MQYMNLILDSCEVKFDGEKEGIFQGYAAKFGDVDSYDDTLHPGAFKETLKRKSNIPMFINHQSGGFLEAGNGIPVGYYPIKEAKEDKEGLFVLGQIAMNHRDGPDLYHALQDRRMDGMSIGFTVPKGGSTIDGETGHRDIHSLNLKEISVVNFPAIDGARVTDVKSEIDAIHNLREAELFLRDVGTFSKSTALALVSRIRSLVRSDSESDLRGEITELQRKLAELKFNSAQQQVVSDFTQRLSKISFN